MDTLEVKSGWVLTEEEWPDFKGKIFRDRPKSVAELLENTVRSFPDRVGFIAGDRRLTYREFDAIVNRIAAGLEKHGVKRGDHVAILLATQLEFPMTFFALMKLGAVVVPLNTRFKSLELAYEIDDSESTVLIVDEEYWPMIGPVRDRLQTVRTIFFHGAGAPDGTLPFSALRENEEDAFSRAVLKESDVAAIMYTSGTTGKPKGAVLHHRGFVLTAMLTADFIQYTPVDKMMCCIPLFHITGIAAVMLSPIFSGAGCVYMRQYKTKDFLELMAREKVTHYMGVVNVIWLMVNAPDFDRYDFSSFRVAMFGGSFATEEMIRGIFGKLPHLKVSVGYGLTESFAMVTSTPYEDALRKIQAIGKPLPTIDAGIMDDAGHLLGPEAVGEIVLRGPKIFKEYWKRPQATKETLGDGWLHTGDIGKIDDEGFLYILDRKKDMINRGGEKIYCLEVENVLCENSKVLEVAVVGVPDPVMNEVGEGMHCIEAGRSRHRGRNQAVLQPAPRRLQSAQVCGIHGAASKEPRGQGDQAGAAVRAGRAQGVTLMNDKVALITGSSRGIGRAIAIGLARQGVRIVVNYQSRQDAAEAVAREITEAGGDALVVKADVGNDDEVKSMVDRAVDKWGAVDILVNNAATHRGGRIQKLQLEEWNLVINSALAGAFHCCRHVVPIMIEKKWGRIINISSYVALHGYAGDTAYGAAKSGLLGLTMSLAKEVATKGITVNAVIPGLLSDGYDERAFRYTGKTRTRNAEYTDAASGEAGRDRGHGQFSRVQRCVYYGNRHQGRRRAGDVAAWRCQ